MEQSYQGVSGDASAQDASAQDASAQDGPAQDGPPLGGPAQDAAPQGAASHSAAIASPSPPPSVDGGASDTTIAAPTTLRYGRSPSPSPPRRQPTVRFSEPALVSASGGGGGGSGHDSRRDRQELRRARLSSSRALPERNSIDQAWGDLFDSRGRATTRFNEVLKGLANYIVSSAPRIFSDTG